MDFPLAAWKTGAINAAMVRVALSSRMSKMKDSRSWVHEWFLLLLSLFRLDDFQRRDAEQEMQEQEKLRINLERVERAGVRADQPIDDSAVVDDMFGFLEDQKDTVSESQAPSAFRWMVNTSIFVIQRVIDMIDRLQGFAST